MTRLMVTGAAGFIGQRVVEAALERGYEVIATDRSRTTAEACTWWGKATFVPADLEQLPNEELYTFFHAPEKLIHLAWRDLHNYRSASHVDEQLFAQYSFLQRMVSGGVQQLLVSGTCFEYGLREGSLDEESPAHPVLPYAIAKDCLRRMLEALQQRHPFILHWVRMFYLYGDGQHPRTLYSQLMQALAADAPSFDMSPGDQVRDYMSVDTAARNLLGIASQQRLDGIINNCTGEGITLREQVERWIAATGKTMQINPGVYPYQPHEPMAFWGDRRKLLSALQDAAPDNR